jgi:hypothetical protein
VAGGVEGAARSRSVNAVIAFGRAFTPTMDGAFDGR